METTGAGIYITLEQAQLLRDMCVNATAQDAKTKIKIGETQLALEEQINSLAPPATASRQIRRAQERQGKTVNGRNNGHAHAPPVAAADPA